MALTAAAGRYLVIELFIHDSKIVFTFGSAQIFYSQLEVKLHNFCASILQKQKMS